MSVVHDWLQVTLDRNSRRGLADAVEANSDSSNPDVAQLLRVLRSSRNELLLDKGQAQVLLAAPNVMREMPSLGARLEAFLGLR